MIGKQVWYGRKVRYVFVAGTLLMRWEWSCWFGL